MPSLKGTCCFHFHYNIFILCCVVLTTGIVCVFTGIVNLSVIFGALVVVSNILPHSKARYIILCCAAFTTGILCIFTEIINLLVVLRGLVTGSNIFSALNPAIETDLLTFCSFVEPRLLTHAGAIVVFGSLISIRRQFLFA